MENKVEVTYDAVAKVCLGRLHSIAECLGLSPDSSLYYCFLQMHSLGDSRCLNPWFPSTLMGNPDCGVAKIWLLWIFGRVTR